MMGLRRGDVVRFRSGGPKMTVEIVGIHAVVCVWFTSDGEFRRAEFEQDQLERVKEESSQ